MQPTLRRLAAGSVLTMGALALLGCVSAKAEVYPEAAGLAPRSPDEVEVFWSEPDFEYRRIGEVSVEACPDCSRKQIEEKLKVAVAEIGGDLAIVESDTTKRSGNTMVPGPDVATSVPSSIRELVVYAGLRGASDGSSVEDEDASPDPPPPPGAGASIS